MTPTYATPEEAAAAVRRGRPGFVLTVCNDAARWVAFEDRLPITKAEAVTLARHAMDRTRDAERVVVLAANGARLHVPAPQHLARPRPRKGGPRP